MASPSEVPLPGPEQPTASFAFDGSTPGPLLRARRGQDLAVRVTNATATPFAVHWHGVRLRNAMDGAAGLTQAPVEPGASFDYRFASPDSGTFWYHPHGPGWGRQVASGLCGVLVVDDDDPEPVDRDLPMLIQQWRPDAEAATPTPRVTVNGRDLMDMALAPNERIRLRLINAACDMASLAFAGFDATIIALDGRPVNEPFVPAAQRIDLAPGGRADAIIDGLMNDGDGAGIAMMVGDRIVQILRLSVKGEQPLRGAPLPSPKGGAAVGLPAEIALGAGEQARLVIQGGPPEGIPQRPLFSVRSGTAVTLTVENRSDLPHAVHPHGHAVRLLHPLDDGWEPYWLDTILAGAGETPRVAFVADNPGRWMIDCMPLAAFDGAGSPWFEVI
jgi:FtsP/CotA-like multicopper oxidase with cupredoxin domain